MSPGGSSRGRLPGTRPAGTYDEAAASRAVRDMFSRIAPRYDLLNHLLSMRFDVLAKAPREPLRPFLERPEACILDLCCGTGDLASGTWPARRASESIRYRSWGPISLIRMLVRAHEKAGRNRGRPIDFVEADALSLPFADASFDLVATRVWIPQSR